MLQRRASTDSTYRFPWVPVFMYHRVVESIPSDDYFKNCLTTRTFRHQMRWLARLGYRTIPLEEACELVAQHEPLPRRTIVLTFDDGYEDTFRTALPILQEYGFAATLFVVTGCVGDCNRWDSGRTNVAPLMSWDQLRNWVRAGQHIGSHTVTHPRLTQLSLSEARHELAESRHTLEDQLQIPVRAFCYPFGDFNRDVVELVAEAGYSVATTAIGPWTSGRYTLHRVSGPNGLPPACTAMIRTHAWYYSLTGRS